MRLCHANRSTPSSLSTWPTSLATPHEVFARAIETINRTGASHELYQPIQQAMVAVGAIGVHVHYMKCDAARRARDAGETTPANGAAVLDATGAAGQAASGP
jgi:hypothetical protein